MVFDHLRRHIPDLLIERLQVTHPGDDNVYFIDVPSRPDLVQIDTEPAGQPPFILAAEEQIHTDDASQAATVASTWLTDRLSDKLAVGLAADSVLTTMQITKCHCRTRR